MNLRAPLLRLAVLLPLFAVLLPLFAVLLSLLGGGCASAPSAPATAATRGTHDGERMVAIRGATLRMHEAGEGEGTPIVFVHGYGSRLESWRAVQPALANGRRTVSYDQRGFGLSERTASGYGPDAHAADLLALMDELHLPRAVLVAHSYGAGVALRAALQAPERVAGIVLVSPFALDEQLGSTLRWAKVPLLGEWLYATSFRGFSGEKYQLAFADGGRFATLAALDEVEAIQAIPGSDQAALATVRAMDYREAEARYHELRAPIRVLWGEADRVTPIRTLPSFAEHLPQATFVRLPGVGHMPSWEAPALVVEAIEQVIAEDRAKLVSIGGPR